MSETVEQYIARITGLVGTSDPVAIIEATPAKIAEAVKGLSAAALDYKPSPDKWSIRQQVAHLVDAEIVMSTRFHWAAAQPGKPIVAFDQDLWAATGKYASTPLELSLPTFTAARAWTTNFVRRLTPAEREGAYIMHEERGKETLQRLLTMMAGHDLNHLKQITALSEASGKANRAGHV
jgi:uncharacterized damage-inducible protein DinB